VARLLEARGAAGPPYRCDSCTEPNSQLYKPLLFLTFGGMCMLAQSRGGACFCTRGAMQGYDGYYFVIAMAKTVTPGGGPRREPGQAAPLIT